jgi:uncharacterized alpha-E superfamily protein/hemerythrin-like domain-containing protein
VLLSSTAEAMFWTGRYFERAQALARAVGNYGRLSLDSTDGESGDLSPLLALVGGGSAAASLDTDDALRLLVLDGENPSSVRGALGVARENLRSGRSLAPAAVWAPVNRLFARLGEVDLEDRASVRAVLEEVEAAGSLVEGQLASSMMRDTAYSFWRIGCHLERGDMLLRTLAVLVPRLLKRSDQPFSDVRWIGLLESIGAYSMYRRRHHTQADLPTLLEFVLKEACFPRSLTHLVGVIEEEVSRLPRPGAGRAALARCVPDGLPDSDASFVRLAERLLTRLQEFSDIVAETYFPAEHRRLPAAAPAALPELPPAGDPFEHLGREHAAVEAVLRLIDELTARALCGQSVDRSAVRAIVEFFTDFGVLGHHEKEEQILMPALAGEGFAWNDGPLAKMRADHRQEHYFLRVLANLTMQRTPWSDDDQRRFAGVAGEFTQFLRAHMRLEQREVFEPGARLLSADAKRRLLSDLSRFDAAAASGVRTAAQRLDGLFAKYGVTLAAARATDQVASA